MTFKYYQPMTYTEAAEYLTRLCDQPGYSDAAIEAFRLGAMAAKEMAKIDAAQEAEDERMLREEEAAEGTQP